MMGELIWQGNIKLRGKGSIALPLASAIQKLYRPGLEVGDEVELYREGERLYVVFPKRKLITGKGGGMPATEKEF